MTSIPSSRQQSRGDAVACIQPAVQVQCKGGFCAGEKLPFSSSTSPLMSSHCGYISVSDAGASSTVSAHAAVRRWHDCGSIDLELLIALVPALAGCEPQPTWYNRKAWSA